jgi:hypothetical protein
MNRLVVRLAVAVLMAAAVGLGVAGPAQAATCATAHGVSVVVDFHQLGGGVQKHCDASGAGKSAWSQLQDVGYRLTGVQRQPGFVCRIDGKPSKEEDACVNTPPSDAYWSLWWSDGKSGKWSYSSQGPASLKVPEGGYVAMSWQSGNGKALPGASPTPHPSEPSASPTSQPSSSPPRSSAPAQPSASAGPTASSSPASSSASPTARSDRKPRSHDHANKPKRHRRTAAPSASPQAAGPIGKAVAADSADAGGSGGLPGWVAPAAVLVLFAGAGAVLLVRRKGGGGT